MTCLRKPKLLSAFVAGLALFAAVPSEARAGFTITLGTTSTSAGVTTYNYTAGIAPDDSIVSGDFFRIYDFGNYVAGSITAPAGWSPSVQLVTATPPPNVLLSHGDDPVIQNLIFTYTGAPTITGPAAITGFSAATTTPASLTVFKDFVGQTTKATGPTAGTKVGSVGDITVPTNGAVPEPASMISCGLGVLLLGTGYALRGRRKLSV